MNKLIEVKFISPKKGKGVFASKNLKKGMVIDIAHFVLISNDEYEIIKDTTVGNYLFFWDDAKSANQTAIPFTICQFMNHCFNPNARYSYNYINKTIKFKTIRDIEKGEEITTNYNGYSEGGDPVWFEVED